MNSQQSVRLCSQQMGLQIPNLQSAQPSNVGYVYSFLENQLIESVKQSIRNELYSNASFLCERLYAEVKNEDVKLLLSECYLGEGKAYKAYEVLKDCTSNANRYKFALTCIKLNKLVEAEKALLNKKASRPLQQQDQNQINQVPNGAAGLYLLGMICERQMKKKEAIDFYTKALLLDPTLWCAFERLSKLQINVEPTKYFNENHPSMIRMNTIIKDYMSSIQNPNHSYLSQSPSQNPNQQIVSNLNYGKSPNIIQKSPANQDMKENLSAKKKQTLNITSEDINALNEDDSFQNELKTPTGQSSGQYITPTSNMNLVQAKKLGQNAPSQIHHQSKIMVGQVGIQNPLQFNLEEQNNQMIGGNLGGAGGSNGAFPPNNLDAPNVKPFTINTPNLQNLQTQMNQGNIQGTPIGGVQPNQISQFDQQIPGFLQSEDKNKSYISGGSNPPSTNKQKKDNKINQQQQQMQQQVQQQQNQQQQQQLTLQYLINNQNAIEIQDLMSLLKILGHAFQQLCMYRCQEAIKIFGKLTKKQYSTGWVLSQVAKCYFEMSKYQDAEKMYKKVIQIEPYRLEGLEYYSTCLWHLKKQVELCHLSNHALEKSLFSPETWCVVGNCYSLQKEHETALKFFSRAIQLNQNFAYAHTLCGHEYVANEDFDSAKKCYQRALQSDERHYNAWWGLGNICLKQEKFEQAAHLFTSAIQINQRSSVLYTYMGMTKHNCSQTQEALQWFQKSEEIDKENSLNKFQKANVLIALNREEEALQVLLDLMHQVPKEAPIHIVIGKIYKKMGNIDRALQHFTKALDLDPKDTNMVKSLIDKIHSNNDINDDGDINIL